MEHNRSGSLAEESIGPYSYKKGDRKSADALKAMALLSPYRKRITV
jgi:hypothetical protein